MNINNLRMVGILFVAACSAVIGHTAAGGVMVGSSTLIKTLDYADTFNAAKLGITWYGNAFNNADGAYRVEFPYGNPAGVWKGAPSGTGSDFWGFPLMDSAGGASHGWGYTNVGNTGADTGVAGTLVEVTLTYALRPSYVVQADGLMAAGGGFSIGSYKLSANTNWGGYGVTQPSNVTVDFLANGKILLNGNASSPGVSTVTDTGYTTGLSTDPADWHNFAVGFNATDRTLSLYVDESLRGVVNTATFASGIYNGWTANGAIEFGPADGTKKVWADNLQIGSIVPEPVTGMLLGLAGLGLVARRRQRAG